VHININNASQFRDEFHHAGRNSQFSYEALGLLFDYFEDVAPEMELDVVAICCDYTEDTIKNIADSYLIDIAGLTSRGQLEAVQDFLQDNTQLIGETPFGFLYANF